jgi:leader peptidase (prepilin peptidase)/N-methyltransferase
LKGAFLLSATATYVLLAAIGGAVAGSFLNVVVHRLPRGESLVRPGSHCTSCAAPIRAFDNIPVLAWAWLRGRCRACHAAISARYPLVEAVTAALCVAVVLAGGPLVRVVLGVTLVLVLVPVALIDLEHHIVPNRITGPAAVVALVLGTALDPGGEPARLLAGAGAGGFFLIAALCSPRGMGMGDVKLAGVMGLLLGREVAPAILIALVGGVLIGLVLIARAEPGQRRSTGMPFGPALALGGLVALFVGPALVSAYLRHFA